MRVQKIMELKSLHLDKRKNKWKYCKMSRGTLTLLCPTGLKCDQTQTFIFILLVSHPSHSHFLHRTFSIWWFRRKNHWLTLQSCSICILLPLFLMILPKRSKLSDHNRNAQQCSQTILFFFAWKIKPLFHICIFPESVCCKNLKLNTNPDCAFFLRTLIVSNHC